MKRIKVVCEKCNKAFSRSNIGRHLIACKPLKVPKVRGIDFDPNIGFKNGTRTIWNTGLSKDTDERVKQNAESASKTIRRLIETGKWAKRPTNQDFLTRLSIEQSLNNRGGKSKWYDYNGQKLQGTWELNVAKKLDELNIKWYKLKVHTDVWKYELNGQTKSYTPDLYVPDLNIYLEIKGYWWGNDR